MTKNISTKMAPFLTSVLLIIVLLVTLLERRREYCVKLSGIYQYERFSKSLDPVENENEAKNNYMECLGKMQIFYNLLTL